MGCILSKDYWWNGGSDDEGFGYRCMKSIKESLPTTLKDHFHFLEHDATTRIALHVRPKMEGLERARKRPWIVIDYGFNDNRQEQSLYINETGRQIQKAFITSIFMMGLKNNLEGAWFNGFTMELSGDPSKTLELEYIPLPTDDPLRLTFKNKSAEEIEVIRSVERLELIGKSSGLGDLPRTLRIYGPDVSKIEAKATPNDGTILLTFPPYKHNPDMEFVWPDYYYYSA